MLDEITIVSVKIKRLEKLHNVKFKVVLNRSLSTLVEVATLDKSCLVSTVIERGKLITALDELIPILKTARSMVSKPL